MAERQNEALCITIETSGETSCDFGKPPIPTYIPNLLVHVRPDDVSEHTHTFLIALKNSGWFVCLPEPFGPPDDEWAWDWLGPYDDRESALRAVPDAIDRYAEQIRSKVEELRLCSDELREHADELVQTAPADRKPVNLRLVD